MDHLQNRLPISNILILQPFKKIKKKKTLFNNLVKE